MNEYDKKIKILKAEYDLANIGGAILQEQIKVTETENGIILAHEKIRAYKQRLSELAEMQAKKKEELAALHNS